MPGILNISTIEERLRDRVAICIERMRKRSLPFFCFTVLPALVFSFFFSPFLSAADDFFVVIKSPQNMSTVTGEIPIELDIVAEKDVSVEKISIFINGALVKEFHSPPYRMMWDAGSEFKEWNITVVAYSTDGRTSTKSIRTRELKIDQYEYVSLVNIYASVKDTSNNFIEGLKKDDFQVFENGTIQDIEKFSIEWKPLLAGIVLDSSLTMKGDKLETAKDAAIAFIEALSTKDRVAIISFNETINLLEDFTGDFQMIEEAIKRVEAGGGTALYDAIYRASDMMKAQDARKVIILLSDGRDESTSGLTPGSLHTFEEAIDKALRSEVIIFSIGVGKNLDKEMDFYNQKSLKEILDQLASDTGGIFYTAERIRQVKKAYSMIADELKHQYSIAYIPQGTVRDGSWRSILVKTKNPDFRVITRKGYFAAKEEP